MASPVNEHCGNCIGAPSTFVPYTWRSCANMTSCTKPEVGLHIALDCRRRKTESWKQAACT